MQNLIIANVSIRQFDGLYSLNDLHIASGKEERHEPANFMRLDQTKALIAEIGKSADVQSFKTITGRNGGTFVAKELVYAYAMWISPKLNLEVIRARLIRLQPALREEAQVVVSVILTFILTFFSILTFPFSLFGSSAFV